MDSILDPERHKKLIQSIEQVCAVAGIPKSFLHQSMTVFCGEHDVDWVKDYHSLESLGKAGLVITGPNSETRMFAMAAALVRNFIDARVVNLNTVLEWHKSEDEPNPTVLFIPNLYTKNMDSKVMPSWKVQQIHDLLISRYAKGRTTVVYVESEQGVKAQYGSLFAEHLHNCYLTSEG